MIFYSNSSDRRSEPAWKLAGARPGARPDSAWHFPDDLWWGRQKSRYCDRTTLRHTKLKPPTICARLWRAVVPDHRAKPFTIVQVLRTEGSDGLNGRARGVLSGPMEALRAPFGSKG